MIGPVCSLPYTDWLDSRPASPLQEGVASFETALRSPSLAASKRKTLMESVEYYRKRIEEIEEELEVEELEELLPEVPSARPNPSRSPTSAPSRLNEGELLC